MIKQNDLKNFETSGDCKFDWFSLISPARARFILANLQTEFNRFAYRQGWELSDKAKEIVRKRLEEIARKDNVN